MENRLFEIFKSELIELGDSNCDWWHEIACQNEEGNEKSTCGSPMFKTPLLSSRAKRERNSPGRLSQKRMKSECISNNPSVSNAAVQQLEWSSPISSKLNAAEGINQESGAVPSSLHPLLDDRSNVSWSSAFATPLTSNVTWSNLNSEEKKVLMPSNSITAMPRTLFSPDTDQELMDHCQLLDSTLDVTGISSQEHNIPEKSAEMKTPKDESRYFTIVEKDEETLQNHLTEGSENKNVSQEVLDIYCSPVSWSLDSGVMDATVNNSNSKVINADQGFRGTSIAVVHKLFKNSNAFSRTAMLSDVAKCHISEADSGTAGFSHTKISGNASYRKVEDNFPSSATDSEALSSETKAASTPTSQDFLHDLSLNTLDELCQATEMISTGLCLPNDHSRHHYVCTTKNTASRRTSTPIVQPQNAKRQRKLAFMTTEHDSKNWAEEGDSIMEQAAQELRSPKSEGENVPDVTSRVWEIKKASSELKKFVYSLNDNEVHKSIHDNKIQIEDLVKSAEILEKAFIADANKEHKRLINLRTMVNNTQEFHSFSKINSSLDNEMTLISNKIVSPGSLSCRYNAGNENKTLKETVVSNIALLDNAQKMDLAIKEETAENDTKRREKNVSLEDSKQVTNFKPLQKEKVIKQNQMCGVSNTPINKSSWSYADSFSVHNMDSTTCMSDLQMIEALELAEKVCAANNHHPKLETISFQTNRRNAIQNNREQCEVDQRSTEVNITVDSGNKMKECKIVAENASHNEAFALNCTIVQQLFDNDPEDFNVYTSVANTTSTDIIPSRKLQLKCQTDNESTPSLSKASEHIMTDKFNKKETIQNISILKDHSSPKPVKIHAGVQEPCKVKEKLDTAETLIASAFINVSNNNFSKLEEPVAKDKHEENIMNVEFKEISDVQDFATGRASPILQSSCNAGKKVMNVFKGKNPLITHSKQGISQKNHSFPLTKPRPSIFRQGKPNIKVSRKENILEVQNLENECKLPLKHSKIIDKECKTELNKTSLVGRTDFQNDSEANKKKINLSEKALSKETKSFSKFAEENVNSDTEFSSSEGLLEKQRFVTVSGMKIDACETLNKAKKYFARPEDVLSTRKVGAFSYKSMSKKLKSFSSSNASKTCSPAVILNSSDRLLDGNDNEKYDISLKTSPYLQSISSAGGKKLEVSSKALQQSRKLQEEVNEYYEKSCEFEPCDTSLTKTPHFQDFASASAKKVNVSGKTLNKARKLLVEFDKDSTVKACNKLGEYETPSAKVPNVQSFATASGKKVNISGEALDKARKLLAEFDEDDSIKACSKLRAYETPSAQVPNFQGFATASGKKVNISGEALDKARKLLAEFDEDDSIKACSKLRAYETPSAQVPNFQGFATASGKKVNISGEALDKARKLFAEIDEVGNKISKHEQKETPSTKAPDFPGFATASGKKVNVPGEALKRARKLFAEMNEEDGNISAEHEQSETMSTRTSHFLGCATASVKKVNISGEALNKARKLFAEVDEVGNESSEHEPRETLSTKAPNFQGFATSGKKGNICGKAFDKAEFDEENSELKLRETPSIKISHFQGFATASGKKVTVSHEAVKKARKLLAEFDEESRNKIFELESCESSSTKVPHLQNSSTAIGKKVNISSKFVNNGELVEFNEDMNKACNKIRECESPLAKVPHLQDFTTESRKKVHISCEALNIARKLFAEFDEEVGNENSEIEPKETPSAKIPQLQGFATASGRKVNVSNEALINARKIFTEVHNEDTNTNSALEFSDTALPNFRGFATASGKEVHISAEVLNKAKQLISECDEKETDKSSELDACEIVPVNVPSFENCSSASGKKGFECREISNVGENKEVASLEHNRNLNCAKIGKKLFLEGEETLSYAENVDLGNSINKLSDKDSNMHFEASAGGILEKTCTCVAGVKMCNDCVRKCSPTDICNNSKVLTLNNKPTLVNDRSSGFRENKCIVNKSKSVETCKDISWTLSQEVKESAAALLADDNWWSEGYTSCPEMLQDRDMAPVAVLSDSDSNTVPAPQPSSPILGRPKGSYNISQSSESLTPAAAKFKVPYKNCRTSAISSSEGADSSKRIGRCLDFGTPFSKRLKTEESIDSRKDGIENISSDISAGRLAAAEEQENLVKEKLKLGASGSRPCTGSLYTRKQEQKLLRWRDVANGRPPERYSITELLKLGVKANVIGVTAENALDYRFSAFDCYSESLCCHNTKGVDVGDGACLVLDVDGTAGVKEVTRAFLASPSIEPSLVPAGWVSNHYRWLIWKLAATERIFPHQFAGRCLTPNMLMLQLKYRYDREIDRSHRPAIRKILEHDDSPAKRLVLCVARIIRLEGELTYELELTDGWYAIRSYVDKEMCKYISIGTICVGTKLITHGAELVNSEQACSPLEVGPNVRLKLFSNSTRRARWDTKLGFYPHPGPLPILLSCVLPLGGSVGSTQVIVARTYPLVYIEKLEEGKSVVRCSKLEERIAAEWERKRQECAEAVFSQVRAELQQYNIRQLSSHTTCIRDISKLSAGDELYRLMECSSDPGALETMLSEQQRQAIAEYQMQQQQQLQQELQDRLQQKLGDVSSTSRTVIPVFKVRCIDPKSHSSQSAMLSIWRPSEEVMHMLKEGVTVNLFNVTAAGLRNGLLQLSAGRHTRYHPLLCQMKMFPERVVVPLDRAAAADFHPPYGELDIVGVVAYIGAAPQYNTGFQMVYLCDISLNVLGVAFWGGVKQYGWEELLVPKTVVAGSNLSKRHGAAVRWIPCVYASEYSSFSSHPRLTHLYQAYTSLQQLLQQQDLKKFHIACEEKVTSLLQGATPTSARSRLPLLSSAASVSSPSARNAELLHKTPETSAVQRRIHKLEQYGEPPALSPLVSLPVQPSLRKEFHVPARRLPSPKTDAVDDSPPFSLESDPG